MVRLAARFARAGVRPAHELGVLRARATLDAVTRLQSEPLELASVRDLLLPGPAGRLAARVYHPDPGRRLPVVLYLHGGGWVMGGIRSSDRLCRRLAAAGDCVLVALEYRLAPETPFPGALEDCLAAVGWLSSSGTAAMLGFDPDAGVTLLGDSAGGNLAAAAALVLRGAPGPSLTRQILVYPCLEPAAGSPHGSMTELADAPFMTRAELEWFWSLYLRDDGDARDPRAVPPRAADLGGLPPAEIVLAELDPLRDEGLEYARRLADAGVATRTTAYPGAVHGFWSMDGALGQAAELTAQLGRVLRER